MSSGLHNEARCGLIVAVDLWSICDAPVLSACRPTSALCECQHAIMLRVSTAIGGADAINSTELFQYLTTHTMASNENVIFELFFALERRVAYLESQLKVVQQQPLTMQQLYERRQEKLDYYRQQYEGPQYVRVKQTKHILLFT